MAIIARMTRSQPARGLGQDYVRTASAKGMTPRIVLFRHGLRNALLPGGDGHRPVRRRTAVSGAVLTETIFGLTGIGRTIFDAITGRDYIVIQGMAS